MIRQVVYRQLFADADGAGRPTVTSRIIVVVILLAVLTTVIGTEPMLARRYPGLFESIEVGFGIVFAVEYAARVWSIAEAPGAGSAAARRLRFVISPMGLLDLAVVVASLATFTLTNATILRLVRLLRIVALARTGRFSRSLRELGGAIAERRFDFAVTVAIACVFLLVGATAMYWAEGTIQPDSFGSIPRALWWSIITLTTVGYGDVSPVTPLGKSLASIVALSGIGLVAMPAGIMAAAFSDAMQRHRDLERASQGEDEQ